MLAKILHPLGVIRLKMEPDVECSFNIFEAFSDYHVFSIKRAFSGPTARKSLHPRIEPVPLITPYSIDLTIIIRMLLPTKSK